MSGEPRLARWLLERVAGPFERDVVLGDLAEEFEALRQRRGAAAARNWYRVQVVRSLVPLLRARLATARSIRSRRTVAPMLWSDLKFAGRLALRSPLVTVAVLSTMAIGVAATTAVMSVVGSVLLDPLPYPSPAELVYIRHDGPDFPDWTSTSYPDVQDWRARSHTFAGIVSFTDREVTLTGRGEPQVLSLLEVTEDVDRVLGLRPQLGRYFNAVEFTEGNNAVVVLSNEFWHRQFGGDRAVLGKTIVLNDVAHTIVGVRQALPTDFPTDAELWRPLAVPPGSWMAQRGPNWLSTIGRMRPGVAVASAQSDLSSIAADIAREFPATNAKRPAVELIPLQELAVRGARPMLILLLAAALLVLATACASIGGLLVARSQQRRREFVVRASLGASRARLLGQMLTESIALAFLGSALGVALAPVLLNALLTLYPGSIPRVAEIGVDGRALLVAVAVALIAGVVFGLAPARNARAARLADRLRASDRASASAAQLRLRTAIVVVQVMLSVVLLVGGGLLLRSFLALTRVDPGFRADGVLTFQVAVPRARYDSPERIQLFYDALLARLRTLPGVQDAASVNYVPLGTGIWTHEITVDRDTVIADVRIVSPDYFRSMSIDVKRGRSFSSADDANSPGVVIVNETLARRLAANDNALGRRVRFTDRTPEIVGVVADVHHYSLTDAARAELYVPATQHSLPFRFIVLRTRGAPEEFVNSARSAVHALDRDLPVTDVATMDQRLALALAPQRFRAVLIGSLALAALLLAVLGLYGVIATVVSGRLRELGIRLALGESPGGVQRRVLGWALAPALLGVIFGLSAAYGGARFLTTFVYGISVHDPLVLTLAPAILLVTATAGALFPAVKASRTHLAACLRE
jgi:putative ABC transport system permease protein